MSDTRDYTKDDAGFVFKGNPTDIDVEKDIEEQAKSKSGFDAFKLAKILVVMVQKMTGIPLYDYQLEPTFRIIYSMLVKDGAEITILYPRQSGKSEVISNCSVVIAVLFPVLAKMFPKELGHFTTGVKMGLLAPQGEQVETVYSRCMERLLSDPVRKFLEDPDIGDVPLFKARFKLKSGSSLTGQSAAKQSRVESKTYHLVFLDESQDIDTDKVRRSIIPMTASTFGTIVRTGTPSRNKGDFYYTIQNNKNHDSKLKTKNAKERKQLHFEYNYKDVFKSKHAQFLKDELEFHTLYQKSVMRDMASMGENSDAFRMAYNVEWLLEVGMFITEAGLEDLVLDKSISFPKTMDDDFIVAGLDIASARAETVLTYGKVDEPALDFGERPIKTVHGWLALKNTNYEEQFHILADRLIAERVRVLYTDNTGVGRGLTDVLVYHLGDIIDIVPYMFTPSSKSEMWKVLDEDYTNRKVIVPGSKLTRQTSEHKAFVSQMTNLQKYWRGSFLVCEKTQGYADDYCDSMGLFNMAGNHLYTPIQEMEMSQNTLINTHAQFNVRKDSSW